MISLGQKVRFNPIAAYGKMMEEFDDLRTIGTVVGINSHGWFSVMYGNNQRTSFFFHEVGKTVHICK